MTDLTIKLTRMPAALFVKRRKKTAKMVCRMYMSLTAKTYGSFPTVPLRIKVHFKLKRLKAPLNKRDF